MATKNTSKLAIVRKQLGRSISFGQYKIKLSKDCQITYIKDDITYKVKDVNNEYDEYMFYEHVLTLAKRLGFNEFDLKRA